MGDQVTVRLTGLNTTPATVVSVVAVDLTGNPSACSGTASLNANASFTVSPATLSFGNVNIGSSAELSFTVTSTRAGVTGTVTVPAPFTIVAGNSFNLATVGAIATVTVRFTPTTTTPTSVNVNFNGDGESVSRLVSGTGVAVTFALTVSKAGAGSGTVTSSPAGINCGPTCSFSFISGTMVTLSAQPAAGSTFTGWSGACTGPNCTVTMSQARAVTATFALQTFALTVTKTGAGTGTVTSNPAGIDCGGTCSFSFNSGTVVTLSAQPAAGSAFTGWSGACTGTNCTVTMSAARAVTATFAIQVSFTDDPLTAGVTVVKVVHITELRAAIAALRAQKGLPAFTWTDPTLTAGTSMIKAVHISELRTALDDVYGQVFMPLPNYTDVTIVAGQTVSKAAHVQELRNAVRAVP